MIYCMIFLEINVDVLGAQTDCRSGKFVHTKHTSDKSIALTKNITCIWLTLSCEAWYCTGFAEKPLLACP